MNILQQLVADAQQKKQQLQNSIGNGIAHIGAAPHPVNIAPAPVVSAIQNAKYGVLAHNPAAQQSVIHQLQTPVARPSVGTGLNNAMGAFNDTTAHAGRIIGQNIVTRPAMEIAQTARQAITHKQSGFTPGSPQMKYIFGDSPIQSLQANHATTQAGLQHSSNPLVRGTAPVLAGANTLLHIANDVPLAGAALKAGVKGSAAIAPKAVQAAERIAPKAAPVLAKGAEALQGAAQTLDKGAIATTKAIGGNIKAASNKRGTIANYDATISDLQKQKADLQRRIQNTPINNHIGVEHTQRHIDQLDGKIAQVQASKPKLTLKDRVLNPNIGLTVGGPNASKYYLAKKAGKVFEGVDGKPRFEIDDSEAKLANPHGSTLGEVLDHPQLYDQYPGLKDMPVVADKSADKRGSFDGTTLRLNPDNAGSPEELRKTILHEVQHAIQGKEHFAQGGSPGFALADQAAEITDKLYATGMKLADSYGKNSPLARIRQRQLEARQASLNGKYDQLQQKIASGDPKLIEQYRHLAGEAEARAVENRAYMSADYRAAKPFYDSLDVPKNKLIVRKGGGPALSIDKRAYAEDLSPEQNKAIADYAEFLKQVGQGNGVDITADGRRVSNNFRTAENKGKAMTNTHWFDQARSDLESGKADSYAVEDYKQQPSLEQPTAAPKATPAAARPEPSGKRQLPASRGTGGGTLPEYGTKQVSGIDKAFRSTRSIIERQGEHGKALADELQKARDTQEIYQAQLAKQLPTVRSLKGKEFENFVEATQGKTAAASPKVEQAIKEWQAVHPTIRDRAVKAGLDVGDLGPSYYPHFIDYQKIFKDKNAFNQALNHLVETGQAKTTEDAMTLLNHVKDVSRNRSFGNLEAQRLVDLPMYDKTPNSLVSYLSSSAKRIAQTEHFGAKDEKALKLITKAGKQGYDTQAMKDAYDVAAGAKRYGETATNFSNKARSFQSITRLGLGALTNTSQNVNTGIVTGHIRTLGAMAKQLSPKTRSFVEDTGVIGDAVLNDLKTQAGFTGKVLGKITAPGFGKVESFNRSVAATAGRDYALRLAQKGDETTLRKLGVTGNIEGNTLTEAQQVQAARKVVEKTQFKVDSQDLPGWTDSPGGKLVAQFRTFSYKQGQFVSNEILKPAAKGNLMPFGRLLAALPVGYGLYEAKRVINGRPEETDKKKIALQAFQNVGGAGLVLDTYNSLNPPNSKYTPTDRRVSMAAGTFGGPTVGLGVQTVGALSDLIQRKNVPSDPSRLGGKAVLGNNGKTYTDATQAARLALNQIPVVGAPIRNRVLPYKAQSQADTGTKSTGTPVDQLKATEKQQNKDLKGSLSSEDYKLSTLNKTDRQKLISEGKYTQAKFDGLDNYVSNKKKQLGMKVPADKTNNGISAHSQKVLDEYNKLDAATKKSKAYNENDYDYKVAQAKYDNAVANGTLSKAQAISQKQAVQKAKVGASFSKDTRDLYGLSKQEVYDLITTDQNGKKYAQDLLAYGDALKQAGIEKNKFRTSKGVESFGDGTNSATKASSGTSLSTLLAGFKTPYSDMVKNSTKGASLARNAHLSKKKA